MGKQISLRGYAYFKMNQIGFLKIKIFFKTKWIYCNIQPKRALVNRNRVEKFIQESSERNRG